MEDEEERRHIDSVELERPPPYNPQFPDRSYETHSRVEESMDMEDREEGQLTTQRLRELRMRRFAGQSSSH